MLEKSLESSLACKETQPLNPKGNQSWIIIGRTDAEAGAPILWPSSEKSPLTGEDPDAGGEGDDRGWDGWMASSTQWTWVWVSSGSWWWTGKTGMLQSMGSQRVGHDWATELNRTCSTCNPMDCSPPGSSVHGISQARIQEWVAISFSRGSFQPRNWTHISSTGRWVLYHWTTREALKFIYISLILSIYC